MFAGTDHRVGEKPKVEFEQHWIMSLVKTPFALVEVAPPLFEDSALL